MFNVQNNRTMMLSMAEDRFAKVWQTGEIDLNGLLERLSMSVAGMETHAEFMALSRDEQTRRKDVGGFCGGEIIGNGQRTKANIAGREMLTLDYDDIPKDNGKAILEKIRALNCFVIVHSTRKHTKDKPRLRLLFPLDRVATVDEYAALAPKVAEMIDLEACDPTSFHENQLMFWPSHCADVEPVFWHEDRPLLKVDDVLGLYADWRDVSEWPRSKKERKALRHAVQTRARQRDPTEKEGIIGEFCRVYSVPEAMDKFLPGVYEPFRDNADRLTYTGGSTSGGAILYEEGKFLYSFHATDPAGGRLNNSFDLVRLHKFGYLDVDGDLKTPTASLPSTVEMKKLVRSLPEVKAQHVQEKGEFVLAQTGDLPDDADAATQQTYAHFFGQMEGWTLTTGIVRKSLDFLGITMRNNEISGSIELEGYPRRWSHENAVENLPTFLLDRFRLSDMQHATAGTVLAHLNVIADERRYNPVLELFKQRVWDGQDRMPNVYAILGVSDPLDMILIRKWFIQSAAMPDNDSKNPFGADGVLSLQGVQGLGKTSFFREIVPMPVRYLFKEGAEIDTRNKDSVIQATSSWITELGELERTTKRDEASLRPFLTAIQDQYRVPFGRTAVKRPRRTSFCASVNPERFLTDEQGNRRFWTIPVKTIDLGMLRSLDDDFKQQLWAQSYAAFCADRRFSFRLTVQERAGLNARNVGFTKPVDLEMEVLALCDFDIPNAQWKWLKASEIGNAIDRMTGRFPPLNRLGRALAKLASEDKRIETVERNRRTLYRLPVHCVTGSGSLDSGSSILPWPAQSQSFHPTG